MSPNSGPWSSKTSGKSGKSSSHTYFSRLSKRFFKSCTSIDSPNSASQLKPREPTQRLCSLKRKSNKYFATQARALSLLPDPEAPEASYVDAEGNRQIETMRQGGMGHPKSSARVPDAAAVLTLRSQATSMVRSPDDTAGSLQGTRITYSTDEIAETENESTARPPINSSSEEIFPNELPTRKAIQRPLPPPKSRHAVRQEAKRARDVIYLSDDAEDAEDAEPIAKKAKIDEQADSMHRMIEIAKNPLNAVAIVSDQPQAWNERAEEQRRQKRLAHEGEGGSHASGSSGSGGTDFRTDFLDSEASAQSSWRTPTKKGKKLFGTLTAPEVLRSPQRHGTTPTGNALFRTTADLGPDLPVVTRPPAANLLSGSTSGAVQPVNRHRQKTFQHQAASMFIDEGYSSFSLPGSDGDERVPENEDELMKTINGSLGPWSPFVQGGRKKALQMVAPKQAYAEQQQDQDAERSRRMREANLAASERNLKQAANEGGGLSVPFLEGWEPKEGGVEFERQRRKGSKGVGASSKPSKDFVELVDGGKCQLVGGHDQSRTRGCHRIIGANQRQEKMTHAALLDIAENYVQKTGPNGSLKPNKRSCASDQPFQELAADSEVLDSRGQDATQTGSIPLLEPQLKSGDNGEGPTGASDLASRRSVISQLTPKRKKRRDLMTPWTTSTDSPPEACGDQPAVEAGLLALRNASVPGNTYSAPKALSTLRQEGSLLDELVRKRERPEDSLEGHLVAGRDSASTGAPSVPKSARKDHNKQAKDTVVAAEAVLGSMGIPSSVFKNWTDGRKGGWMDRGKKLTAKRVDMLANLVAKNNTLQNLDQPFSSSIGSKPDNGQVMVAEPPANLSEVSSNGRQPVKRSRSNVAAAEAVLREVGLEESVLETLSNKQKAKWARLETELAAARQKLENFRAQEDAQEQKASLLTPSAATRVNGSHTGNDAVVTPEEDSESEESEEEEGWQYAIKWQGIEQPKSLADAVPLTTTVARPVPPRDESESEEGRDDAMEELGVQDRLDASPPRRDGQIVTEERFPNRQQPDAELLRQMQRKRYEDWSDDDGDDDNDAKEDAVHEYVVKAESWGMTSFPADHLLILGRYLDREKAEAMVRSFISSCQPDDVSRSLEIHSVWSDGNFSQKMIRDGEAGCRAFVEPEVVSARQYPGLKDKVVRRQMYAVLFERTISQTHANDDDGGGGGGSGGALEEDVTATTVDDMALFTTKSLANWHAKKLFRAWYKEHLRGPQNRCWRGINDENLCKHVEELNEDGSLFSREESFQQNKNKNKKGGATDTMKVWVKEIAPKGPRN